MDVTDQWIREMTPDPLYHPLSPTIDELEQYNNDLIFEGNQITIEWAIKEMQGHQMGWVRLGLVADRVRRYRLYKNQFPDWNTFCKKVMGKENWQMNRIINCSLAVMELVKEGFAIYPTCVSQAQKLLDCCKKSGNLLLQSWEIVVERLHEPQLITAKSICEVLGFPIEHNDKISKNQRERINELANRDGMTFDEKLDELLALDENPQKEDEELEDNPESEELKEQLWHKDLNQLIKEHDHQIWFLGTIMKLFDWQPKVSQFNWLRQLRCQV